MAAGHGTAVVTMEDLLRKWGTRTIAVAVERLIAAAPPVRGDGELASLLGEMMADLQCALEDLHRRGG
jgi:hypothetical protein